MIRIVGALLSLTACALPSWSACGVDATFSTTLTGDYVYRGVPLGPPSLFGEASLTRKLSSQWSVRADLWSSTRFGSPGPSRVQELDYTAEVTWAPHKLFSVVGGWIYYDALHPRLDYQDTAELYAGISFSVPGAPGLVCYYDHRAAVGLTICAHAGQTWDLGQSGWSGTLYGEVGLRSGHAGPTGLTYGDARFSLSHDLGHGWTVGPTLDLWFPSAATDPANRRHFRAVGSLGLGYNKSF